MRRFLERFVSFLLDLPTRQEKAHHPMLGTFAGTPWEGWGRRGQPSGQDLLCEWKNTVYSCANINAAVCAAHVPRLYVATYTGQSAPKCTTRTLPRMQAKSLAVQHKAEHVAEVTEHPLLTLLGQVNPVHNLVDLLELTTLDQEIHGSAYWWLQFDALGVPEAIWPVPAHLMQSIRRSDARRVVERYEYRGASPPRTYRPEEIIQFRYPHPADPYGPGWSPLAAVYEQASLASEYLAFKQAIWSNVGMPGVILSPSEVISDRERQRLEAEWNQKFRQGGRGRALIAETGLQVQFVEQSLGDVAVLAEQAFSKEEIANAFGVPIALLTKETNLANLQASRMQHALLTIRPRLRRRDEKLNEQLVPWFDPTRRLFFQSDDPIDQDVDQQRQREEQDLRQGVRTINEVRQDRGLEPVSWGEEPWLPLANAPTDFQRRTDHAPATGRNSNPDRHEGS